MDTQNLFYNLDDVETGPPRLQLPLRSWEPFTWHYQFIACVITRDRRGNVKGLAQKLTWIHLIYVGTK